jgi:hypothetical protein
MPTFILPSSLSFLSSHLPSACVSIGVSSLPARNIIQSIGDFFASKSGKNRISYLAASENEIKLLHFQGSDLISEKTLGIDELEHLEMSEGTSDDGLIHLLHIHVGEIKSINKKGVKKIASHYFKCMPPLLGQNAAPIQAVDEILWAQQSKKRMQEILKSWPATIEARLAEEFRIAEEKRRQEEEAKRLAIEEKIRIKEARIQAKMEAKRLKIEAKEKLIEEKRHK